jgi:hypothetical protein
LVAAEAVVAPDIANVIYPNTVDPDVDAPAEIDIRAIPLAPIVTVTESVVVVRSAYVPELVVSNVST